MDSSRGRLILMVLAPAVLGLGVTACTQSTSQSPQAPANFTTTTASPKSAPTPSTPTGSATATTPAPSPPTLSPTAPASDVAAIGPVWPIEPRTIAASPGHGAAVLTAVRTGRHGSFERLTLEFTSSFGEANVGYVPVVHADPSDKVVPLQGSSFLRVAVHGAVAHWTATPIRAAYAGPSTVTPGYPTLKQVSIAGDFEAVLSFGIGLDRTAGFQVTRLQSPDRLVVDIAESPPWQMWPDDNLAMAREIAAGSYQGHMPSRNSGASVAWSYAFAVYGWANPVVTRVPGTDAYRLAQQGSPDHVTVRAVPQFPTLGRSSIFEIVDTR
jgi:hypothetical protein